MKYLYVLPVLRSAIAITLFLAINAFAENNDAAAKNALAKAQYMMRQVSNEKAELEKQIAKQKEQIDALTKENEKIKVDLKNKMNAVNPLDEVVKSLKDNGQKNQSKLENELSKNDKLTAKNEELELKLSSQSKNFDICYGNNKKLYEINKEILGQYENKGFWDALKQKEPFTAIERVKVENLVQDYQYNIDSLKVKIVQDDSGISK